MANIGKSRQYVSREKTPKWLEERTYEKQTQNEYDPQLEKEREAFLKQLQVDWEEQKKFYKTKALIEECVIS